MIKMKTFLLATGLSLGFFGVLFGLCKYAQLLRYVNSDILTWVSVAIFFSLVIGIYFGTENTSKGRRKG